MQARLRTRLVANDERLEAAKTLPPVAGARCQDIATECQATQQGCVARSQAGSLGTTIARRAETGRRVGMRGNWEREEIRVNRQRRQRNAPDSPSPCRGGQAETQRTGTQRTGTQRTETQRTGTQGSTVLTGKA